MSLTDTLAMPQKGINFERDIAEALNRLARSCQAAGGRVWVVGGAVRDALLGRAFKDIDLEVHGLSAAELRDILRRFGRVKEVGRSFGVFKVVLSGREVDVALPRSDSSGADRLKTVSGDPFLGLENAARRRDLSINAIAYDPLTREIADPCGGIADLRAGLMRAADPARFGDDPLRALRVAQFAARFKLRCSPELAELCRAQQLAQVPAERIRTELDKLLLRSERPSLGLSLAREIGVLDQVLPGLGPAREIDAAVDRAAGIRQELGSEARSLVVMWATALHAVPADRVADVLTQMSIFNLKGYRLRREILGAHRSWPQLVADWDDTLLRTLAEDMELAGVGWTAWSISEDPRALAALTRAEELGILARPLPTLLYGRDLLPLGITPGPALGVVLSQVRQAQLRGEIDTSDGAKALACRLWSQ